MGAVSDSPGHNTQVVLPGENVPGIRYGSCVHRAHVTGISAGVHAKRHGSQDDAIVVADDVIANRVPSASGLSCQAGGGYFQARLPVEA